MKKNSIVDDLRIIGKMGDQKHIDQIKALIIESKEAEKATADISKRDVFDIGKLDELERLRRNALALNYLLSMILDVSIYIKRGVIDILQSIYEKEKSKMDEDIAEKQKALRHEQYVRAKSAIVKHIKD